MTSVVNARYLYGLILTALWCLSVGILFAAEEYWTNPYNVVWNNPSHNASGSMPLGNGELGINLWVEENGDLYFYLSRNDSLSEISQLCKVGKIRISLSPNPFINGNSFCQVLHLKDGTCVITAGPQESQVKLCIFVDIMYPVVHVIGQSSNPVSVKACVETWRQERQKVPRGGTAWTLDGAPFELWQEPDTFVEGLPNALAWYHRNETSLAFEETVKVQSLESIRSSLRDPLLYRTFGGWVAGDGFERIDRFTLTSAKSTSRFSLVIASPCEQTRTAEDWLAMASQTGSKASDETAAMSRTAKAWQAFWERSWVICDVKHTLEVPRNDHPVRIGVDAQGGSRFPGVIGKARIFDRALSEGEVAEQSTGVPAKTPTETLMLPDCQEGLSLEAWIKPNSRASGRILDKISVGGDDGFLLDTYPGGSLRLIIGSAVLQGPSGVLVPDQWHHVVGTFDAKSGLMCLFLDGKRIAQSVGMLSATGTSSHDLFLEGKPASTDAMQMTVGQAHTLQRYMQACAGRGIYPIKFNGSIFTVEPSLLGQGDNPDWRRWGDCHWWQNMRIPYHAMLAAGDFDLMHPLFNMFETIRPFAEARARLYHGADGCYFAETMTVWGTYANRDYGWDRTGHEPNDIQCMYWRYAWNQGLELTSLMLDYYDYTRDNSFLKTRLLPMAESVLRYFDSRFPKDTQGRIILSPTQAVETYWYDVINDTPSAAGLNETAARLCALPAAVLTPQQKAFFQHIKQAAPVIPIETIDHGGRTLRRIAVAQKYKPQRSNVENPELFPVWPFKLYGLGKPMLEEARNAYLLRGSHNDVGWGYDSNAAACLGLTEEAARILKVKIINSRPGYRWPATWGPNFDWLPDQDHGGNLMTTIHLMLLQADGDRIFLLPAWPREWDVSFKLHAPRNTTVECLYRAGKIEKLVVTPEDRLKDIVLPQ